MNILADTNILSRLAEPAHAMAQAALLATTALRVQGHILCVFPQNLYEFWEVSTRPRSANGIGKSIAEAVMDLTSIKTGFTILDDTPAILTTWESLVAAHSVIGKNAHDARLVAAMIVHGVSHVLTFNDADFKRFTAITALNPAAVLIPNRMNSRPLRTAIPLDRGRLGREMSVTQKHSGSSARRSPGDSSRPRRPRSNEATRSRPHGKESRRFGISSAAPPIP